MAVYLTAAAATIYYALHIQIRIAFSLDIGKQNTVRIGMGLFSAQLIYQREISLSNWKNVFSASKSRTPPLFMLRTVMHLIPKGKLEGGRLSVQLGTGDAAQTAILCGAIAAAVRPLSLAGILPSNIQPDFSHKHLLLSAGGMVYVNAGHIIRAALAFARQLILGRIQNG